MARLFHSVAWQSVRDDRKGDGETDFVLLHPGRGLLVLEVKGSAIEVEGGQWFSTDEKGPPVDRDGPPFKGLEADVVIATLTEAERERARALACVRLIKARVKLAVIGVEGTRVKLGWSLRQR